ncbi:hypothetical protein GCM10022384_12470 [Streptomyces marokkonensis]|uniref:Uncharacterized protein n=1 Tax=Streptomyces marokkonensis TaxID=324855 RepID=A0ABP7P8J8_9ACTN
MSPPPRDTATTRRGRRRDGPCRTPRLTGTSGCDGRRLIAFGDALHPPIRIDHPEWSSAFDHDPAQAAGHRRRLVAEWEEPDTIGFGIHFADVVFGDARRGGDGPARRPLDA